MKQKAQISREKLEEVSDREFVLGTLFVVANRLQTLLDREFGIYGMTTKQWYLSIIIGSFDEPPTLGEAAAVMGSTHQNVKQVALKLKDKGFIEFTQDPHDGRAIRLMLTQKSNEFWVRMQERSGNFMEELYEGLGSEGLNELRMSLGKLMANIEGMDSGKETKGMKAPV